MGERRASTKAIGLARRLLAFGLHLLPLAVCLVPLGLSGCGFATVARLSINDPIRQEDIAFIVPGQTTLADVVKHLGAPDELVGLDGGAAVLYHFRDAKYSRVNFGWPARFWLTVSPDLILSAGGLGTDVFEVVFDSRWVVREHAFAKHTSNSSFNPWPF